jgi:hypothetical protein
VLDKEIPCPLCKQTINIYGDHATCCTRNGDIIIRHNTLRNLIDNFASDGLLSPELEKLGILGNTTGRRPGDVTLHRWDAGGALAIDVAITSALSKSAIRRENPCEEYALTQKHGKYDKSFAETNYSFCAMIWETLGALNSEGEEVLRQILRFAAKQLGVEFSSYCGRAWARISCCLQRSVGQAILNRIDGREFRDPLVRAEPDTFLTPIPLCSPSATRPFSAQANSAPEGQASVSLCHFLCEEKGDGTGESTRGQSESTRGQGESEGSGGTTTIEVDESEESVRKRGPSGEEKGRDEAKTRASEQVITRGEGSKMHAHTHPLLSVSVCGVEERRSMRLTRQHDMHTPNTTMVCGRGVARNTVKGSANSTHHTSHA